MPVPKDIRPLWDALQQQVLGIHFSWDTYRDIFAKSAEQIEILNRCAPNFFYVAQHAIINDVQLNLARLAETHTRSSATLERLIQEISRVEPKGPLAEWRKALIDYREKCEQIMLRRHKTLAHSDHDNLLSQYGLNAAATPLPGPSRQEIEEALLSLREFMNLIGQYFGRGITVYDLKFQYGDAETMLSILKGHFGKASQEEGVLSTV